MWSETAAVVCLIWYIAVIVVSAVGYIQLVRHYSKCPPPSKTVSKADPNDIPHVTIMRPVKGLEPCLYQCLAATFQQTYPVDKLTIYICVSSRQDPAIPIIQKILDDFPEYDARLFVEEEDPALGPDGGLVLGPNPKIRNMSRAYREAKGDIVWIIDCNVWIGKGVAGRMVDELTGRRGGIKNKFVHQLPLVVDIDEKFVAKERGRSLGEKDKQPIGGVSRTTGSAKFDASSLAFAGGRLEEMFMSSSHAKFYIAINTVLIAPCIVGKSTMFRRSHLNYLTKSRADGLIGIDYFSENICEDHMIGDLLWKQKVPEEEAGERWGKHAAVFGDLVIQPMAGMRIGEYIARRVRWLRVRKFTVPAATLVEHGTESVCCSLYGAYAVTKLPWFQEMLSIPPTWTAFWIFFFTSVSLWSFVDWTLYLKLHSAASIEIDDNTPEFTRPPSKQQGGSRRPYREWLSAWIGREVLAFPIWSWAVFGGTEVSWRGKRFTVGLDMKVHAIDDKNTGSSGLMTKHTHNKQADGSNTGKYRVE